MPISAGYVSLTASNIADAYGNKLPAGSLEALVTDNNDCPLVVAAGGTGSAVTPETFAPLAITNGALPPGSQVLDTSDTKPPNCCIRLTVKDADGKIIRVMRRVQTSTGVTLNLDAYQPQTDDQVKKLIVAGPQGPRGLDGEVNGQQLASIASVLSQYSQAFGGSINTFGQTNNAADTNAAQFPSIIFHATPTSGSGTVRKVSLVMGPLGSTSLPTPGTPINIIFATLSGSTFTSFKQLSLTSKGFGLNAWTAGNDFPAFDVPAGTYIGYGMATSASQVSFKASGAAGCYSVSGASSMPAGQSYNGSSLGGVGVNIAADVYQPTTPAVLVPSVDQLSAIISSGLSAAVYPLAKYTAGYGGGNAISGVTNYGTNAAAGQFPAIVFANAATAADGLAQSISVNVGSVAVGSALNLVLASYSGGLMKGVATFQVTTKNIGVNTWTAGKDFPLTFVPAGTYVGYGMPASASSIGFATSGGAGAYTVSGTASLPAGSSASSNLLGGIGVNASLTIYDPANVPTLVPTPADFQSMIARDGHANRTPLFSTTFASLPSSAATSGSGAWTTSANGLTSPSSNQGYGATLFLQQVYAIDQRTYRYAFQILASGTIAGFGARPTGYDNDNSWGSLCVVDSAAGTIAFTNAWDGGSNPGVASSANMPFSVVTGRSYALTITVNRRQISATLYDPLSAQSVTVSAGNNSTDPGGHPTAGIMCDYPAFAGIAGQFRVSSFALVANTSRPRAMFVGDSLTYGYTLPTGTDWAHQLAAQIGSSAVVSGRGGAKAQSALSRMQTEVSILQPDTLVVDIGTNDSIGSATTYLPQVVAAARPYVRTLILAVLSPSPGFNGDIPSINTLIKSQTVDAFLRFDLATTASNDGSTQNTTLFNDTVHYNASGTAAVLKRQPVDAPWLLD